MPSVEVKNLCKTYISPKKQPGMMGAFKGLFTREKTEIEAVKDISFSIEQGELVGFLGPNGAGKTTTLKMLAGILYPTKGELSVLGYRPTDRNAEMLKRISLVMGNKQQLWWDLPAWDSFVVLRELYEVSDADFKSRSEYLIDALQLKDKIHTQVRKLSLGERMKCELVASLLHRPQVIFLDEPTLGLDIISQKRIREFLKELHREEKCTILLTSHYMQDVQELCDRVIVIDHGSLVFDGTLDSLTDKFADTRRIKLSFSAPVEKELIEKIAKVVEFDEDSATLEIPRGSAASLSAQALQELPVADIAIQEVDIEDVIRDLFARKP